jgi:hypothetical protein
MRFHLTMFCMVVAVSFGMHAMANAATLEAPFVRAVQAPTTVSAMPDLPACSQASHGGH